MTALNTMNAWGNRILVAVVTAALGFGCTACLQQPSAVPAREEAVPAHAAPARTQGFAHPGIPLTRQDLDFIKAHLNEEPWKTGFKVLRNDPFSQLSYRPRGPWEVVERFPGRPLRNTEWKHDMQAVYNLARMWYFTGDEAYAKKAHDIIIAWAEVQKRFDGWEAVLDLGDQVHRFAGGADILRGTWPGWTEDDTKKVKKLFREVYLPATAFEGRWIGPANKGTLSIVGAMGLAVFLDDRELFDSCVDFLQTHGPSAFPNTLSTGQIGESGRDLGHNYGQMVSMILAAEIAWKQGVDVYSDLDNRLLAVGEYYARHASGGNPPFITMGATDALYWGPCGSGWPHGRRGFNMLITAYKFRKGMPTPWLDLWRLHAPIDAEDFCQYLPEDRSTAVPRPFPYPPIKSVSRDLNLKDIGNAAPVGVLQYSNGVWALTGGGEEIWRHGGDSFTFASKPVNGDFAIVARVDSIEGPRDNSKAALMVREQLGPDGIKAWVAVVPRKQTEWFMSGWSSVRGNQNWEKGSRGFPDEFPVWLKLERINEMIYQYWSPDGTSWTAIGAGSFLKLGSAAHVGLAVCSLQNNAAATAKFSRVYMTGGDGNAPVAAPSAPRALLASPGNGKIPLRWAQSFGADRYLVKRAGLPDAPFEKLATVKNPSYIDETVEVGRTNYYVVSAVNAAGASPDSPGAAAAAAADLVNVTGRGESSASRNAGEGNGGSAWAFDQSCETWWENGAKEPRAWSQYDLGAGGAREVVRYDLAVPYPGSECDPKSWTLEGSNDGGRWDALDLRTNQEFGARALPVSFAVGKPGSYRYYRLNVTENKAGAEHGVQLSELMLMARPRRDAAP